MQTLALLEDYQVFLRILTQEASPLSGRYPSVIKPPKKVGVLSRRFASFFQKRPSRLDGLQLLKLAFCVSAVLIFERLLKPCLSPRRFATFGTFRGMSQAVCLFFLESDERLQLGL